MLPLVSVAIPVVRLKLGAAAKAASSCCAFAEIPNREVDTIPIKAKALTQPLHVTFILPVPFPRRISCLDRTVWELSTCGVEIRTGTKADIDIAGSDRKSVVQGKRVDLGG